jgi:hypothetical protein
VKKLINSVVWLFALITFPALAESDLQTYAVPKVQEMSGGYFVKVKREWPPVFSFKSPVWTVVEIAQARLYPNVKNEEEVLYVTSDFSRVYPRYLYLKPMVDAAGEPADKGYTTFVCDNDAWTKHKKDYSPCNSLLVTQTMWAWTGASYEVSKKDYDAGYRGELSANTGFGSAHFYELDPAMLDKVVSQAEVVSKVKQFAEIKLVQASL